VLSIIHRGASGNVLASVSYQRAASGEPEKITREDGSYVVLAYDSALRIDRETYYSASGTVLDSVDYDYDLDGNRIGKQSLSGGYESYSYEQGFKLAAVAHGTRTDSYGYDAGGRLTRIDRDGVTRTLEYNANDKLTRVIDDGIEKVRYVYDGTGRRVDAVENASLRHNLVAPNVGDGLETAQAITDANGTVLAAYVFAGEHPILKIAANGTVEYLLADVMGSVIAKSNSEGVSTANIKYDGFGNITSATGSASGIDSAVGMEPRFQGMALDAATGIYYVRARSYDARAGRFLSRDGVDGLTKEPERNNFYVFCRSNPHIWVDPSGYEDATVMGVSIAAVVNAILDSMAAPTFTWVLRAFAVSAGAVVAGGAHNEWNKPGNQEKLKKAMEDLGKALTIGIGLVQEMRGGGRPYWPVSRALLKGGLVPILPPMTLGEAQGYAAGGGDLWSRRGMTAREVYPQGVEMGAPEINYGYPGSASAKYKEGSRFFCHYHPVGRTPESHSFFGPAQDVRIGNQECLQFE
jgi:RHS repeat-associated protein